MTALDHLRKGSVILCPTDTVAGLSCDATNATAIARVFDIKQRPAEKSLIVLVSSLTMLEGYVPHTPEAAYQLLEVSDTPLTIVYPETRFLPDICRAVDGSVGIRVVHDGFVKSLIERFRKPIVSTSANVSGQPSPVRVSDVSPAIRSAVDFVVDAEGGTGKPSGIIKFRRDGSFSIIRKA